VGSLLAHMTLSLRVLPNISLPSPAISCALIGAQFGESSMKVTRRAAVTAGLSTALSGLCLSRARAEFGGILLHPIEGAEDFWHATDAYIYGYPLVTLQMTRKVTAITATLVSPRLPLGQLFNFLYYPDASYRDVTAPTADTMYSSAFFDVGEEPWVLSHPDMGDRYFLLPMLDAWTEVFAVPGSRSTEGGAQTYAITGPGWSG